MKKTTIKKVLALVVGVLIITASLTAAFGASAAAPADAEADYYVGIKTAAVEYPHQLKPVDALGNLDFEDEFRYWAGGKGKNNTAAEALEIVTESGNSYAKVPETGYASNMLSALFKLDNVNYDDELVVIYDVKGADGTDFRIKLEQHYLKEIAVYDETTGLNVTKKADGVTLINCSPGVPNVLVGTAVENSEFVLQTGAEGWTTLIAEASNKVNDPIAKGQSYTGDTLRTDVFVCLLITCGDAGVVAGDKIDAAIDNIRICKVTTDGDDKVYTDVATNAVIYPEPKYPSYFGTAADGLDSNLTHYPCQLTPADDIYNLDFSDGFICWGGRALASSGALASTAFDIITEADGNKYAQVKTDGYVSNISTVLFNAKNVQAGDSLVVIYDVKGKNGFDIRPKLVQEFLKEAAVYDKTTGLNTAMKADGSALLNCCPGIPAVMVGTAVENGEFAVQTEKEGWTTLIAETNIAVYDPKSSPAAGGTKDTLRDDIFLQVVIGCPSEAGVTAGDVLDAAVDNIRIAKVVDGAYIDIVDNSVIYDPNGNGGAGDGGSTDGGNGGSVATGDSVLALAALFFVSGAAVFGTAKAMKNR